MANYSDKSNGNTLTTEIRTFLKENFISDCSGFIEDDDQRKLMEAAAAKFSEKATRFIEERISLIYMKNKLDLLFEYEKHYLSLIKEYKEEIKFASSLQEDLRKERANFFSATLREVYATLQATKVGPEVEALWLENLVSSYTDSLDLSSELAKENTLSRMSEIKAESNNVKEIIDEK